MNSRHIHIDWYFKVLLLALLLGLGVEYAYGYDNTIHTINFQSRNNLFLGGSKEVKPATIRMREHKMDFTLPDLPQFAYNPTTGEIETTDAEGNPQTVKIDVPENASYESIFPMLVTDNKGNTYQISPSEQNTEGTGNDVENENKDGKIGLDCERVDRVGDFNTETLSSKYGYVHFERGEGKYAFDNGQEKWYRKSVKADRFYKPFAKGYIAPWKLVPSGENDIVIARYDGLKNIDLKKVRFVSEPNSAALPARLNETEQTWTVTLKSVATGAGYDVFAVYEGAVIGKLRVVSYAKQQHKVTLVPINEVRLDKATIEQELNAIYNPVGVQFTVNVDERMRDNYSWEVESEKDGLLSTVGKSFWGYDKELKESTEMLNLQKSYQQVAGTLDDAYLFVLNGATGLEGQKGSLLGEMPRKSRFGYIFAGNSPNTEEIVHTIAHELGHGIFTLQHTFDAEYGKGTQGTTNNLLDYTETGKELAAFQWNVMANPAVFTGMDKADDGKLGEKGSIWLTPTWVPFIYNDANTTMYRSDISNGTIGIIVKYKGNLSYAYTYDINKKAYYSKELQDSLSIVTAKPSGKDKVFLLRHQTGEQLKVYQSTWDYVTSNKGKIIFDHNPNVKFLYQVENASGVNPKNDRNNKTQKHQDNKDSSKQGNRANVKNLLKNITDNFGRDAELCIDGKNYRLDTQGDNLEVDSILSDDEINRGVWTDDREYITRFSIDSTGTVQLQAFGIKESLSKNANHLDTLSTHIRQRTNELLAKNHVTDLGTTYLSQTGTFADGDRIRIDGSYGKIISEGISLTTHLLKTGEIQSSAYLSSSGSAIHAPGLVTGSIEVVAQKVTDLTSLGTLAYDIATSEDTRSNLVLQFKNIKDEIGEDPKAFFPIFRDVVLTVTTGNTPEEWDKSINSKDSGERSHLATRGTGNAILTLMSGVAIVKELPEIAQELGKKVRKSNVFRSARQRAIAKFGKDAEEMIYVKFNKDGGAAAEIIAHYDQEGLDALKKVNNIDDVARELVKNKTVYRAVNESTYNFEKLKNQGIIDATPKEYPTYVSLDKYDDAATIQQKLQLPQKPTWLAEFDGNQLIDDIRIPNGKYMGAEYKEVLCKSFPEIKGLKLEGGGSQFITNSQIKVNRLINLETGEIIQFSH